MAKRSRNNINRALVLIVSLVLAVGLATSALRGRSKRKALHNTSERFRWSEIFPTYTP